CPLIAMKGVAVYEPNKRRAGDVKVYGVDERLWKFNGVEGVAAPQNGEALVSESLARELGGGPGEPMLLRLEKPSDIPVESLHGRKEDPGKTIRLKVARVLRATDSLAEFSLQPQQDAVRAVFVSLNFLQKQLEKEGRVNTILVSGAQQQSLAALVKNKATLDDLGLKLRVINDQHSISVE